MTTGQATGREAQPTQIADTRAEVMLEIAESCRILGTAMYGSCSESVVRQRGVRGLRRCAVGFAARFETVAVGASNSRRRSTR